MVILKGFYCCFMNVQKHVMLKLEVYKTTHIKMRVCNSPRYPESSNTNNVEVICNSTENSQGDYIQHTENLCGDYILHIENFHGDYI